MGKQVTVKSDFTDVVLPTALGLQAFNGGAVVVLTDAEYAALTTSTTRALSAPSTVADPVRPSTDPGGLAPRNLGTVTTAQLVQPGYNSMVLGAATIVLTAGGFVNGTYSRALVELKQDATGGRLVTHPAGVKWAGGAAPTLTTTAAKVDLIEYFSRDGGTTLYGRVVGQNF